MIGCAASIRVVFLDLQAGLMIEQSVENVRCLTGCGRNDLGVVGTELIAYVGVEGHAWLVAMTRVDVGEVFSASASSKVLAVGRRSGSGAPELRQRHHSVRIDQPRKGSGISLLAN